MNAADACGEQERGGGMSQVVEADGGKTGRVEQRFEMIHVEVRAPQRAAGGIAEDPAHLGKAFADSVAYNRTDRT